jgi:hypothetical protein
LSAATHLRTSKNISSLLSGVKLSGLVFSSSASIIGKYKSEKSVEGRDASTGDGEGKDESVTTGGGGIGSNMGSVAVVDKFKAEYDAVGKDTGGVEGSAEDESKGSCETKIGAKGVDCRDDCI